MMAARWLGLARPNKKNSRAKRGGPLHSFKECTHALGALAVLGAAAGLNFALYPEALANVVSGELAVAGFVPSEPAIQTAPLPATPVVNDDEVRLLAATAWGEARSEGELGMRAVAHVMVNRVGPRFGEDLATVILSPKQFSVWNRGDPNRRLVLNLVRDPERYVSDYDSWQTAQRVAREVLSEQSVDPTNGALFYHTHAVRPSWARYGVGRQVLGAHVFYADVPDRGQRRTPRVTNVAQIFGRPMAIDQPSTAVANATGPRAGRVRGIIQQAPASMARQLLPSEQSDVNAAATPTLNGVPITRR